MDVLIVNLIVEKILALMFSFLILGNYFLSLQLYKDKMHPAVLFSLFWFILTSLPLLIVIEVPINPFAILYIFSLCFTFTLSGLVFIKASSHPVKKDLGNLNSKFIRNVFYASFILSFVLSLQIIIINGVDLNSFFIDFFSTTSQIAKNRTHEETDYGIVGVLSFFFTYFSALIGGIRAYIAKQGKKMLYFLALLPSLAVMISQSSKIVFLVAFLFLIGSNFLLMIYENRQIKIKMKLILRIFLFCLLFSPVLLISFMSREGYTDFSTLGEAYAKLKPTINSYFFGSVFAFSDFFSAFNYSPSISNYVIERDNMGYYSFKPFFDFFGGTKVFPPGYYPDNFSYEGVLQTNLYTAFRGFLQDFGLLGTIIFFFLFGFFFNSAYSLVKIGKSPIISSSIYIMFIAYLGLSYIINIFTARYVFLVCTAFVVVLYINKLIANHKRFKF